MKKILIIAADGSHFPRPILGQLSAYHKYHSDEVNYFSMANRHWAVVVGPTAYQGAIKNKPEHVIDGKDFDIIYIQKIFSWTKDIEVMNCNTVLRGGSGFAIKGLPEDSLPEGISQFPVDYSLWPTLNSLTLNGIKHPIAYGFLSIGCSRNCDFCYTNNLHGGVKTVQTIEELTLGFKLNHVVLLDDSLLLSPNFYNDWNQIVDKNINIIFHRGVDTRLVNDTNLQLISKAIFGFDTRRTPISFTYDRLQDKTLIEKKMELVLKYFNPSHLRCFTFLDGYDFKSMLIRVQWLLNLGIKPMPTVSTEFLLKSNPLYIEVKNFLFHYAEHWDYGQPLTDFARVCKDSGNDIAYLFYIRDKSMDPIYPTYNSIDEWAKAVDYPNRLKYLDVLYNGMPEE